ncbi:hypothetical protein [Mycobacterium sp.]|uniref:hypothetical protein n=1 Tax=Mycobacterium sp. TaxID=1785 RepID=UPI003D6C1B2B
MNGAHLPGTSPDVDGGRWQLARRDPAYAAFWLLRIGFVVLPIWMGIDKFTKILYQHWPDALAPWIVDIAKDLGLTAQTVMYIVGVIEIVAGIAVAIKPRYAGYVVAAWLAGIIINLLTYPCCYDIALRDFGLLVAAVALAWLGAAYDQPGSAAYHDGSNAK